MQIPYENEQKHLNNIYNVIANNPYLLEKSIQACIRGMQEALKRETDRATDMELIAVGFQAMSMNKRYNEKNYKWATKLIASKLSKHTNYARINWGTTIEELELIIEQNKS